MVFSGNTLALGQDKIPVLQKGFNKVEHFCFCTIDHYVFVHRDHMNIIHVLYYVYVLTDLRHNNYTDIRIHCLSVPAHGSP